MGEVARPARLPQRRASRSRPRSAPRGAARRLQGGRAASSGASPAAPRHGPRPIDVDVLLLGDLELRRGAPHAPPSASCARGASCSCRCSSSAPDLAPRRTRSRRSATVSGSSASAGCRHNRARAARDRRRQHPDARRAPSTATSWSSTGASRPTGQSTGDELAMVVHDLLALRGIEIGRVDGRGGLVGRAAARLRVPAACSTRYLDREP